MIRTRLLILQYIDRLNTYEELNGGYQSEAARTKFKPDDYDLFREQNIVEYCVDLARKADWKNVETLMVFHPELAPHRLAILRQVLALSDWLILYRTNKKTKKVRSQNVSI